MEHGSKKIAILGAGISGLSTAFWLVKNGFKVTILEKGHTPGGTMKTRIEGDYLLETGPNSGQETTPLIKEIVDHIGLSDDYMYASNEAQKRYILRKGKLHALPMSLKSMITTKAFSIWGKLRLLREPFISAKKDPQETIGDFVKRRLGKEFLDYAIDPFISGIFAGNPSLLCTSEAFPKLYNLELQYGSLIKGAIQGAKARKRSTETSKQSAKMFSFKQGMGIFPSYLADFVESHIRYDCHIVSVHKEGSEYGLMMKEKGKNVHEKFDIIVSTLPAEQLGNVFSSLSAQFPLVTNKLYYPPVKILYAAFKKNAITQPLDGFGFLNPSKENRSFLGAIWNSVLFPERCPQDEALFTLFIGGARKPNLFDMNQELVNNTALKEFKEIMGIEGVPTFVDEQCWEKAIPQYNVGYSEIKTTLRAFEREHQGIFLSGNLLGGISLSDCIKNSKTTYEIIKDYIEQAL